MLNYGLEVSINEMQIEQMSSQINSLINDINYVKDLIGYGKINIVDGYVAADNDVVKRVQSTARELFIGKNKDLTNKLRKKVTSRLRNTDIYENEGSVQGWTEGAIDVDNTGMYTIEF